MIDKQARLSAIMMSIKEYNQKIAQYIYGAELALRTGEYEYLESRAQKLVAAEKEVAVLNQEARELQEAIENEAKAELL